MPPVAPQISTLSPCFIRAPWSPTSMRYEVALHSALTAASSHDRWVGLRHQLVGLDDGEVGEPAEVGLEPPDQLVRREHRVVVGAGVLVVDVVAVDGDLVARLPVAHRRPDPQDHARRVGADDVVRQGVARAPLVLAAHLVEEAERRQRFEDRGPHRVEVDARAPSPRGTPRRGRARGWRPRRRGATCAGPCPTSRRLRTCRSRRDGRTPRDTTPESGGWRMSSPLAPAWMASRICCMRATLPSGNRPGTKGRGRPRAANPANDVSDGTGAATAWDHEAHGWIRHHRRRSHADRQDVGRSHRSPPPISAASRSPRRSNAPASRPTRSTT